jgi:hypothetical protein
MDQPPTLELGAWLGKGQAFGLMRNRCSAAQAECLKELRERRLHDALGLNWEEFCRNHLGISRSQADKLIQRLDEFGGDYFRLSELMRISPATYRSISGSVSDQHIEIGGERVPIVPENGQRIRRAVADMRIELAQARELRPTCSSVTDLQFQLDRCFSVIRRLLRGTNDAETRASTAALVNYSIRKLKQIAAESPKVLGRL